MKVIDLFSCVGCHALGMIWAGHEVVWLCESSPWRRSILAHRFPGIPIHEDVRTATPPRADVCFGGPPCQGTSTMAAVQGGRDGRTLWSDMLRAGDAAGAEWIVVEQPPGNAEWEAKVTNDLCRSGRHVGRLEFSAWDLGAPYLRRRVYLVAGPSLPRLEIAFAAVQSAICAVKGAADARGDWHPDAIPPFGVATWRAERVADRRERLEALGDSNPPHMAEVIGHVLKAVEQ